MYGSSQYGSTQYGSTKKTGNIFSQVVSDAISISGNFLGSLAIRVLSDSITLAENISKVSTIIRSFIESISISDLFLVKSILKFVYPILKRTPLNFLIKREDNSSINVVKKSIDIRGNIKRL